eukprot:11299706-Alexandrium_andersonii.AAC.1
MAPKSPDPEPPVQPTRPTYSCSPKPGPTDPPGRDTENSCGARIDGMHGAAHCAREPLGASEPTPF